MSKSKKRSLVKQKTVDKGEISEEVTPVDMAALAPSQITGGMLGTLLKKETPRIPEVKLTINIMEFKFGNKRVANSEVITIHKGNKTTISVPFSKALDFTFSKVENEMVFKFAVTGSGDLLGFIYLEIPEKFRTIRSFKLDDWFPVKQVDPEEDDEIIRVQNFLARIVISYKATRKLELLDYFPKNVPQAKVFQMMAKNLKSRLNTINKDMKNFNEEGFKYLHDFERRILQRRMNLMSYHRSPVRHKNLKAKEFLNKQKQVFIKGKNVARKHERIVASDTRHTDYYNKDGGKFKLKRGANPQKAIDHLMKELTLAKKELSEKNSRLRSLEESQMTPENLDMKRQIEQMKDDLQSDKANLTIKLVDANKELNLERSDNKDVHDHEMEECRDLKTDIDRVMEEYKQKYRALQNLEAELKGKTDDNDELNDKVRAREEKVNCERGKLDKEKEELDELEDELDNLKANMMLERGKIHKKSKNFGDERGEIGLKERQLRMQQEFLRNQREDFENEKNTAYKKLSLKAREINELSKLSGLDESQLTGMRDEYDERLLEVEKGKKKNKMEGVRLWRLKNKLEDDAKQFLELKRIADQEKSENQRSLEGDYDFIDEQMNELENRKRELDELKNGLEEFENTLGGHEDDHKQSVEDFNENKASFFKRIDTSDFSPKNLEKIARDHGINPDVAKKAEENQKVQKKALENKKTVVRASIMGLAQGGMGRNTISNRRETAIQRRTTMVNRMSMTGGDLNTMKLQHNFGTNADVNKFLEGIFNQASANYISSGKKTLDEQIKEMQGKVDEVSGELKNTKVELNKSKLAYLLKNVMNVLEEQAEAREAKEAQQEEEDREKREREEKIRKKKADADAIEKLKEMSRKQQARFIEERKKKEEAAKKKKAKEEKARKKLAREKKKKREEAKNKGLFGAMGKGEASSKSLKEDLVRICEATIGQLEKELETAEDKNKVQERITFLVNGKKCLDNIFGITLFLDKNKGKINDKFLRKMEKENPDFDFETIRRKYERKIIALVEYIKQIRSNYNFFNHNVDRNILIN